MDSYEEDEDSFDDDDWDDDLELQEHGKGERSEGRKDGKWVKGPMSAIHREKIRAANKGRNKGVPKTEAHKRKIARSMKVCGCAQILSPCPSSHAARGCAGAVLAVAGQLGSDAPLTRQRPSHGRGGHGVCEGSRLGLRSFMSENPRGVPSSAHPVAAFLGVQPRRGLRRLGLAYPSLESAVEPLTRFADVVKANFASHLRSGRHPPPPGLSLRPSV